MSPLVKKIIVWTLLALLVAASIGAIVKGYDYWRNGVLDEGDARGAARVQIQWGLDKEARSKDLIAAVDRARSEEQKQAADAAKGEKNARDRAESKAAEQAAAARRATAAAGGLSGHLATLDAAARAAGAPGAAACPGLFAEQRDRAIQARGLFGSCVAEYRSLGEDAAGTLAARELALDTAIGWMRATGAPGADELQLSPP
jgi:hypothetical protein